jgi:hypothetical protein
MVKLFGFSQKVNNLAKQKKCLLRSMFSRLLTKIVGMLVLLLNKL